MQFPNAVYPNPSGVNPRAFYNSSMRNLAGPAKILPYDADPASAAIRILDPLTISSGKISRATAASTAILGFVPPVQAAAFLYSAGG